jgi:hypothetical protein
MSHTPPFRPRSALDSPLPAARSLDIDAPCGYVPSGSPHRDGEEGTEIDANVVLDELLAAYRAFFAARPYSEEELHASIDAYTRFQILDRHLRAGDRLPEAWSGLPHASSAPASASEPVGAGDRHEHSTPPNREPSGQSLDPGDGAVGTRQRRCRPAR